MAKFHKIGKIMTKKDKSGSYIALGDPKGKKYAFSVDIRIRDANDAVIFEGSDVFVTIKDPRDNPHLTEEQKNKIPDFIEAELIVVEQDKE